MTSLTRLSLANRLIVGMATVAIVIFGVLAALSLRQELLPSTQVPTAIVTATYPGASPEIVADEVATPLESGDQRRLRGHQGARGVHQRPGQPDRRVDLRAGQRQARQRHPQRRRRPRTLPDGGRVRRAGRQHRRHPRAACWASPPTPRWTSWPSRSTNVVVPALSGVEGVRQVQVAGQDTTELVVTLRPDRLPQVRPHARPRSPRPSSPRRRWCPAGNSYDGDTELAIQVGKSTTSRQAGRRPGRSRRRTVRSSSAQIADVEVALGRGDHHRPLHGRPALSVSV